MSIRKTIEARGLVTVLSARLTEGGPKSAEEWEAVRKAAYDIACYARRMRDQMRGQASADDGKAEA